MWMADGGSGAKVSGSVHSKRRNQKEGKQASGVWRIELQTTDKGLTTACCLQQLLNKGCYLLTSALFKD